MAETDERDKSKAPLVLHSASPVSMPHWAYLGITRVGLFGDGHPHRPQLPSVPPRGAAYYAV